jgi:hypothetical protein
LRPVPHRLESNPVWLALFDVNGLHSEELTGRWSVTWGDMDHL